MKKGIILLSIVALFVDLSYQQGGRILNVLTNAIVAGANVAANLRPTTGYGYPRYPGFNDGYRPPGPGGYVGPPHNHYPPHGPGPQNHHGYDPHYHGYDGPYHGHRPSFPHQFPGGSHGFPGANNNQQSGEKNHILVNEGPFLPNNSNNNGEFGIENTGSSQNNNNRGVNNFNTELVTGSMKNNGLVTGSNTNSVFQNDRGTSPTSTTTSTTTSTELPIYDIDVRIDTS